MKKMVLKKEEKLVLQFKYLFPVFANSYELRVKLKESESEKNMKGLGSLEPALDATE